MSQLLLFERIKSRPVSQFARGRGAAAFDFHTAVTASGIKPEFPFSILFTVAPTPAGLSNGKFKLGFEPKGLSTVAQLPLLPRVGVKYLKPALFRPTF
jgi:hypothetical protein